MQLTQQQLRSEDTTIHESDEDVGQTTTPRDRRQHSVLHQSAKTDQPLALCWREVFFIRSLLQWQ